MTPEERDLLLKDLCGRLPYNVRVKVTPVPQMEHLSFDAVLTSISYNVADVVFDGFTLLREITELKPYLSPLSSMSREQRDEYISTCDYRNSYDISNEWIPTIKIVDWCNENHFDYRGLISAGLAEDATGLNIYNII